MAKKSSEKARDRRLLGAVDSVLAPSLPAIPPAPLLKEAWSIVVAGNIDPRQHHPLWYQQIGCLSEEECKAAMAKPLAITPPFATFDTGTLLVVAQEDRWHIQTSDPNSRARLIEITDTVFKKLWEAPVIAFGINCRLFSKTRAMNVTPILTKKLLGAGLGLPLDASADTKIVWSAPTTDYTSTASIGTMPIAQDHVLITYDRHHPIPRSPELKYFDLGEFVAKFAMRAWDDARAFLSGVVDEINRSAELNHGV
jgi:hypothetical protein